MSVAFFITAIIAVLTTALAISRANPVHALLFFILSLLSVAFIFYLLGAPFLAALEIITYAGAVMVLFIFVVMLLNPDPRMIQEGQFRRSVADWIGAGVVALVLLIELIWSIAHAGLPPASGGGEVGAATVGATLYGPYLLGVEIVSVLLLSAIAGVRHIGMRHLRREREDVFAARVTSPDSRGNSVFHGTDRPSRTP